MIFEADFISPLMEWRSWIVSFDDDVGLLGLVWLRQWWRRLLCKRFSLLLLPLSLSPSLSDCVMHARMGFSGLVQCPEILCKT